MQRSEIRVHSAGCVKIKNAALPPRQTCHVGNERSQRNSQAGKATAAGYQREISLGPSFSIDGEEQAIQPMRVLKVILVWGLSTFGVDRI
jgi:hypothetical protein